jgi:hypothetical protein
MSIKGGIYCASDGLTVASPRENCSAWLNLLWVERETYFWALQFIVAVLCLIESALLVYIHSSGFRVWVAFDIYIVLDILVGVPFILAVCSSDVVHCIVYFGTDILYLLAFFQLSAMNY